MLRTAAAERTFRAREEDRETGQVVAIRSERRRRQLSFDLEVVEELLDRQVDAHAPRSSAAPLQARKFLRLFTFPGQVVRGMFAPRKQSRMELQISGRRLVYDVYGTGLPCVLLARLPLRPAIPGRGGGAAGRAGPRPGARPARLRRVGAGRALQHRRPGRRRGRAARSSGHRAGGRGRHLDGRLRVPRLRRQARAAAARPGAGGHQSGSRHRRGARGPGPGHGAGAQLRRAGVSRGPAPQAARPHGLR